MVLGVIELPSNIRIASWLGAQAVKSYSAREGISHLDLDAFIQHLELLLTVDDIPNWDAEANELTISGMGDPLPSELSHVSNLLRMTQSAREISASQIYGQYAPADVTGFLLDVIAISQFDADAYNLEAMCQHSPSDGWGGPIPEHTIDTFTADA